MQNTNHIETKTNTASRQWLVAYVQSCLEKKTAQRLAAMGIECYLPVQSEIRQWSDRRKRVGDSDRTRRLRLDERGGTPPV